MRGSRTAEHQLLLVMPLLMLRKVLVVTSYSVASKPYGLGVWLSAAKKMRSIMMNLLNCALPRTCWHRLDNYLQAPKENMHIRGVPQNSKAFLVA